MPSLRTLFPLAFLLLSPISATPLPSPVLHDRAGAPIITGPIPSACHITAILPPPSTTTSPPTPRYTPAASAPTLYSYFLPPSSPPSNHSQLFQHCLDTCFAYGTTSNFTAPDDGDKCHAAYMAWQAPNPFGGSDTGTLCLMFSKTLTLADFAAVPSNVSGWVDAVAKNLGCPQECA